MGGCGAAVRPGGGRRLRGAQYTQVARGKGAQPFAYDCAGSPSERLASGRHANASYAASATQRERVRPPPLTGGMACRPKGFMDTAASCPKQARVRCMCTARALHTLRAHCMGTAWAWAMHPLHPLHPLHEHRMHAWNACHEQNGCRPLTLTPTLAERLQGP